MFFHVFPPSSDLYTPSPHEELCRLLGSPLPTHTTDGSEGAMAMSPIVETPSLSNTGRKVVPLLVVFQTPPEATPIYTMLGLLSTTATSSMRPPNTAGPISRNSRFLSASVVLDWPPARTEIARQANSANEIAHKFFLKLLGNMMASTPVRPGMILRLSRTMHHLFL